MDRGNTKQAIPNTLVKDVNELWVSGRKIPMKEQSIVFRKRG